MKKFLVLFVMLFLVSCGAEETPVVEDENNNVIEENVDNLDNVPVIPQDEDTGMEEPVNIEQPADMGEPVDMGQPVDVMDKTTGTEEDTTIMNVEGNVPSDSNTMN